MRIAQVSPLFDSVPPVGGGEVERVVSCLTEELVRQGHEVTLFASGDSRTGAELVAPWPRALGSDPQRPEPDAPHALLLEAVVRESGRFDLVHFHLDCLHLPLLRWFSTPHLTTLHEHLDLPETVAVWTRFPTVPLVSVSDAQREQLPALNWQGTVQHDLSEGGAGPARMARQYLAIYQRLAPGRAPYELGSVDVALPPQGGAVRGRALLVNLRPSEPKDLADGDGER